MKICTDCKWYQRGHPSRDCSNPEYQTMDKVTGLQRVSARKMREGFNAQCGEEAKGWAPREPKPEPRDYGATIVRWAVVLTVVGFILALVFK